MFKFFSSYSQLLKEAFFSKLFGLSFLDMHNYMDQGVNALGMPQHFGHEKFNTFGQVWQCISKRLCGVSFPKMHSCMNQALKNTDMLQCFRHENSKIFEHVLQCIFKSLFRPCKVHAFRACFPMQSQNFPPHMSANAKYKHCGLAMSKSF